jgi:hypothetical protein
MIPLKAVGRVQRMPDLALPVVVVRDEPGAARPLICDASPLLTGIVDLHKEQLDASKRASQSTTAAGQWCHAADIGPLGCKIALQRWPLEQVPQVLGCTADGNAGGCRAARRTCRSVAWEPCCMTAA